MFSFIKQHKALSVLIFLNVVVIAVVVALNVINNAKTATIDVNVAPEAALIEVNGTTYDDSASYNVLPGDYHVKISMEGMQTKEFDFTLPDGGFEKIHTYLLDEDGGFGYYWWHFDDESILAGVASDEVAKKFVDEYSKVYNILNILPIVEEMPSENGFNYGVNYAYDTLTIVDGRGLEECSKPFCLYITDTSGTKKDYALSVIRNLGYNPDSYQIIYKQVDYE